MNKPFYEEVEETLKLCKEALESCGDNYGSYAADTGHYEAHYDADAVEKALAKVNKLLEGEK